MKRFLVLQAALIVAIALVSDLLAGPQQGPGKPQQQTSMVGTIVEVTLPGAGQTAPAIQQQIPKPPTPKPPAGQQQTPTPPTPAKGPDKPQGTTLGVIKVQSLATPQIQTQQNVPQRGKPKPRGICLFRIDTRTVITGGSVPTGQGPAQTPPTPPKASAKGKPPATQADPARGDTATSPVAQVMQQLHVGQMVNVVYLPKPHPAPAAQADPAQVPPKAKPPRKGGQESGQGTTQGPAQGAVQGPVQGQAGPTQVFRAISVQVLPRVGKPLPGGFGASPAGPPALPQPAPKAR